MIPTRYVYKRILTETRPKNCETNDIHQRYHVKIVVRCGNHCAGMILIKAMCVRLHPVQSSKSRRRSLNAFCHAFWRFDVFLTEFWPKRHGKTPSWTTLDLGQGKL